MLCWWTDPTRRMCMLRLSYWIAACVWCRYTTQTQVQCTWNSWKTLVTPCESLKTNKSMILLGDFNARVGNNANVWKGMIGWHCDADINDNGRLLVQLCSNNTLCIINSLFKHRCVQARLDFYIVSADLFHSVLDVHVKRDAELSAYCHLVVCNLLLEKPPGPTQMCRTWHSLRVPRLWGEMISCFSMLMHHYEIFFTVPHSDSK